jgi:hypothetical protein
MPTIHHHDVQSAFFHLAALIEERADRCDGEYDPVLDDLEREFAELLCQFGHA